VLIPEQSFTSFGIVMVDLHSPTASTIARKEAARTAREAYEKRVEDEAGCRHDGRAGSVRDARGAGPELKRAAFEPTPRGRAGARNAARAALGGRGTAPRSSVSGFRIGSKEHIFHAGNDFSISLYRFTI
jgi:hypothetical protein